MSVTITTKACRGCLACMTACGSGVFETRISRTHKVTVEAAYPENCVYCLVCLPLCRFAALQMFWPGQTGQAGQSDQVGHGHSLEHGPGPDRPKARKG